MSKKYLRVICSPYKLFGDKSEENYKVNDLLRGLGKHSWNTLNKLKDIHIGMEGVLKVSNDNRPKWLLNKYNIEKLEAGIYALIKIVNITKDGKVEIEATNNLFAQGKIISKEEALGVIGKLFNNIGQGYLPSSIFQKIKQMSDNLDEKNPKIPLINKISIKNYFSLVDIELKKLKKEKEIYIVGENGDGKTLFLQALVLALSGDKDISTINDFIKPTKSKMNLLLVDSEKQEYRYKQTKNSYRNVVAYGVNRGKYIGKKDVYGYLSLFSNEYALTNPEEWLKDLDYRELKGEQGFIPLKDVKEMLKNILDNNIEIDIQSYGINFTERGTPTRISELSEGYRSVIVWIIDLLSRLSKMQPYVKKLSDFRGVVLVDEVDLHLHPKWGYSIIQKLRTWFPNIQFIFTTHSPTVILGASKDAIFFKIYKEDGVSKISQPVDNIKNLMANSVATSPLFNLDDARARYSDEDIDTSDDFLYSKIHKQIAQYNKDKGITEKDIFKMIGERLRELTKDDKK